MKRQLEPFGRTQALFFVDAFPLREPGPLRLETLYSVTQRFAGPDEAKLRSGSKRPSAL